MSDLKLPERVLVGAYEYIVEAWPSGLASAADRYGECDRMNSVIRVRTDVPRHKVVSVLLHELLHAMWGQAGLPGKSDEEPVVEGLTNQLAMLMRFNPGLLAWVEDELRAPR